MNHMDIKYVHHSRVHNFSAAEEMVPYIVNLLQPNSVVDVGCGIGTWLKVFLDNGVLDYLGIDGNYLDKSLLKIDKSFFVQHDLETYYASTRKFDLVISLEVAEHLKEESADEFINTLTDLGDVVVFSAAVPNQGGQNHLNEQKPSYWIEKFKDQGFECFDILRPVFWDNTNVDCWYRQNIFLFSKRQDLKDKLKVMKTFCNAHLVHPELLQIKEGELLALKRNQTTIIKGKKGKSFYWKLFISVIKNIIFSNKNQ
jgi:SAM-dependent methyltransferase